MDELKKITPELSKIKKENPFTVPKNYFDDFPARLQMKIEAEKEVLPSPKNRIIQILKPAIGLAASFLLIFMLVQWPLKNFTLKQVANTNSVVIELYDDDYLSLVESIDENSFYALLEEPVPTIEYSDDELITYLGSTITDYEIIVGTNY
jgi:hypothetical protein